MIRTSMSCGGERGLSAEHLYGARVLSQQAGGAFLPSKARVTVFRGERPIF